MQVRQFEKENGPLPAVVYISGTESFISLVRLVAFTGTRFLRSAAANACITFGSEEETAQMQLLLSVLGGGPGTPVSLSLEEVSQLLCACHFALAEALLGGLARYLAPDIANLDADDVRTCLPPHSFPSSCGAVDVPRLLLGGLTLKRMSLPSLPSGQAVIPSAQSKTDSQSA